MLDKRASWMHATCVVVLILSANTGAENEMLKIDCDSCVYGTGLKQSKRHNECYVPTLGLAVPSTLDGSVKVERILHSFKREHFWMEILKISELIFAA